MTIGETVADSFRRTTVPQSKPSLRVQQPFSTPKPVMGRAVQSGYQPQRQIQTGIGAVTVKIPKMRSTGEAPVTFRSWLIPPYVRMTRTLEAFLPWPYLKCISNDEMGEVLGVLLGQEAKGFSAGVVSRLKAEWETERDQ